MLPLGQIGSSMNKIPTYESSKNLETPTSSISPILGFVSSGDSPNYQRGKTDFNLFKNKLMMRKHTQAIIDPRLIANYDFLSLF